MKSDSPKRCSGHIREKRIERAARLAVCSILLAGMIGTLAISVLVTNEVVQTDAAPVSGEAIQPYYMTEEYAEMKRREQAESKKEAQAIRESIEAYEEEQQRKAEEESAAMQESYEEEYPAVEVEPPEDLKYPFNTMSQDWSKADLEGFVPYEIPEDFSTYGGYFPKVMQVYLYCICRDMGFEYPVAIAMIEQESGYKYNAVGSSNDTGYFQIIPKHNAERMERLGATDMLNPYHNALVAVDLMTELLDKYDGNMKMALTAYNCGPTGAYRHYFSAGLESNGYARSVLKRAERIRKEMQDAAEDR